jgi:hypothetical protein
MNIHAFESLNDGIEEFGLLKITVNAEPQAQVGSYFEDGNKSFPMTGMFLRHVQSGYTFHVNRVDKNNPFNHIAVLSTKAISDTYPTVKANDVFMGAGFAPMSEDKVLNKT